MATIGQILKQLPYSRQHGPRRELWLMVCEGHDPEVSAHRLLKDIRTGCVYLWKSRAQKVPLEPGHVIRANWSVYWRFSKAWQYRVRKLEEPLWTVAQPTAMQVGAVCELSGAQHMNWEFRPVWSSGQVPHRHLPTKLPFEPFYTAINQLKAASVPPLQTYLDSPFLDHHNGRHSV